MRLYMNCNVLKVVVMMADSPVKGCFAKVLKENGIMDALLLFAAFGVAAASLVPPQLLKLIIDKNLVSGSASGLARLAAAYIAVLVLIGAFDFMKEAVLTVLGQKITREIRVRMMEKLEKVKAGFFSGNESGAVVSRFTNDVDAINSMFTSGIAGMFIDCLKIAGIVISIWLFSGRLGLITLVLLPVIYLVTRSFQKRMLATQVKNRALVGRVNNHISESLKNMRMIKAFSKEAYMENKYTGYLLESYRTIERVNFYDSVFPPVIQLIRAFVIGAVVVLSSEHLNYLGISLGMAAASIDLISNLFAPVESLGMELQSIQQAISGVRRVEEFLAQPEDAVKNHGLKKEAIIPEGERARLIFDNVSFGYEEGYRVLKNISLKVNPGEKVTFVGRTGVGKSTLFKLCMGLLEPDEGSITINGTAVHDIPNSEKRRLFGYVAQDLPIIKGTVADQVSLKDEGISRENIEKALEFVGLKDYVAAMEKGLDTIVDGEALFSQGQKQLLAVARAVVTDPPILLLDEITANLDSITEEKLVSVLQRAGSNHTILSVSHRLSSMLASDTVVILEDGKVRSTGSPELLLKNDEWYRSRLALEKLTWS